MTIKEIDAVIKELRNILASLNVAQLSFRKKRNRCSVDLTERSRTETHRFESDGHFIVLCFDLI